MVERDGNDVPELDRMPRRFLAHAVDADMAALDQLSRRGARLHHPRVPQPFIETLSIQSIALRGLAILVAGELFLERREFCKWRIRIDRTVALARVRAGRVLTVRRAGV